MYRSLYKIFDDLASRVDNKSPKYFMSHPFTSIFYGDPAFIERKLIPELVRLSATPSFRPDVYSVYINGLYEEKRRADKELEKHSDDSGVKLFYSLTMENLQVTLAATDFVEMIGVYEQQLVEYPGSLEVYDTIYRSANNASNVEYVSRTWCWYWIGLMLYMRWHAERQRTDFLSQAVSLELAQAYAAIDVDLAQIDTQFLKYKILSVADHHRIQNNKDNQTLFDERLQKNLWIHVPRRLLFALEDFREQGLFSKIAFNIKQSPTSYYCWKKKNREKS